jgi:hypothetical protein
MKTHWKKLTNPDYIGAYALENGKDLNVKITKVVREMVTGTGGKKEECTVAYLEGQKPMILNNTNCKQIAKLADSSYIEDWNGLTITLYIAKIRAFGEDNVECLRVRKQLPVISLPELTPQHKRWNGAKKAIAEGSVSIEQIKESFSLSPQNEKLLCSK